MRWIATAMAAAVFAHALGGYGDGYYILLAASGFVAFCAYAAYEALTKNREE